MYAYRKRRGTPFPILFNFARHGPGGDAYAGSHIGIVGLLVMKEQMTLRRRLLSPRHGSGISEIQLPREV